jgi:hypothetical protein
MKMFSTFIQIGSRFLSQYQITSGFTFVLAAVLFSAGCSKSKSPSVEIPAPQAVAETTPAQPAAAEPSANSQPDITPSTDVPAAALAANTNAGPDLGQMDRALLRWLAGNKRRPASFEDFAATASIPIPPPPAGEKYVIDKRMHVELVEK